nr:MAG TPA: hypothetical protein [Caudoviricetes sp.]
MAARQQGFKVGQNFNTNNFTIGPWTCSMGLFFEERGE